MIMLLLLLLLLHGGYNDQQMLCQFFQASHHTELPKCAMSLTYQIKNQSAVLICFFKMIPLACF